jgi:hypothetical protein
MIGLLFNCMYNRSKHYWKHSNVQRRLKISKNCKKLQQNLQLLREYTFKYLFSHLRIALQQQKIDKDATSYIADNNNIQRQQRHRKKSQKQNSKSYSRPKTKCIHSTMMKSQQQPTSATTANVKQQQLHTKVLNNMTTKKCVSIFFVQVNKTLLLHFFLNLKLSIIM